MEAEQGRQAFKHLQISSSNLFYTNFQAGEFTEGGCPLWKAREMVESNTVKYLEMKWRGHHESIKKSIEGPLVPVQSFTDRRFLSPSLQRDEVKEFFMPSLIADVA